MSMPPDLDAEIAAAAAAAGVSSDCDDLQAIASAAGRRLEIDHP